MSFVLQGEVNIDGRKGIVTLKSIQREATRTSQSFDRAGSSTSKLVASFLKANSAASVFGTSLRALGRFGGAGILGAGTATALNRFGEAVKRNATEYFQAQKSLADAFEVSFKSKNVSEAQAGLERTKDIADELRGKLTQLGALGNLLEGLEKLTGLKIFGVEDTKKALEQAKQQIQAQEEIVAARKKEKEEIDKIEETTRESVGRGQSENEQLKLVDQITKQKKNTLPILQNELKNAQVLRGENEEILSVLESTNFANRNNEEIEKRRIARKVLELNIQKALNAITIERFRRTGELLGGSKAGRQALSVAQQQRERSDRVQAFRDEEAEVARRQIQQPGKSKADIRKQLAREAVGLSFEGLATPTGGRGMSANSVIAGGANSENLQKMAAMAQVNQTKSVVGLLQIIANRLPSPPVPV